MNLIERARQDFKRITTATKEFSVAAELWPPDESEKFDIRLLHTKHNVSYDADGNITNTRSAHVSISEEVLKDLEYPYRDQTGNVTLRNHFIVVGDSSGQMKSYKVAETMPDETIGLILCRLTESKTPQLTPFIFDDTFNNTFN